jgi:hypothetical protein
VTLLATEKEECEFSWQCIAFNGGGTELHYSRQSSCSIIYECDFKNDIGIWIYLPAS